MLPVPPFRRALRGERRRLARLSTGPSGDADLAEIPTSEIPVRFPAWRGRRRRIRADCGRAGTSGGGPAERKECVAGLPVGGSVGRSGAPGRPAPRRRPPGRSGDVQGHRRVPVGQGGVECPPVGDRQVVQAPHSTLKCNTSGGGDRFSGRMMLRIGQQAATVPVTQHGRLPCPRAIAT